MILKHLKILSPLQFILHAQRFWSNLKYFWLSFRRNFNPYLQRDNLAEVLSKISNPSRQLCRVFSLMQKHNTLLKQSAILFLTQGVVTWFRYYNKY